MNKLMYGSRKWVALCAALVIVFQSLLTVWAVASPSNPALDAFGNPLCLGGVASGEQPSDEDRPRLPDCCTYGCSMVSPVLPVPDDDYVDITRVAADAGSSLPFDKSHVVKAPDYQPSNPRAPSLMD